MADRGRPLPFAREQRLAVGARCLAIPIRFFADVKRSERLLVADALQRIGLYPSAEQELFSATQSKLPKSTAGVYLVGAVSERLVKVGFSGEPDVRLRNIRQQVPFSVVPIAFNPGASFDSEQFIHSQLKPWKKKGEWFYLTPASLEVLQKHFPRIDYKGNAKTGLKPTIRTGGRQ